MDDEPPWLADEEQQVWLQFALLLTRLPTAPERQRLRDLAEFTGTSLSRLSNVIRKLEGEGWVARTPDPRDGRSTFAVLTEAGYAKVVASAPGHVQEVRRLVFDPLSAAQLRRFGSTIHRILDVIDPHGCDPEALLHSDGEPPTG